VIGGIHHLGLTVRDTVVSAAWYEDVLGFRRVGEFESTDGARRKVFLRHDGLQARLGLTEHRSGHLWTTLRSLMNGRRDWPQPRSFISPIASANSIPGAAVLVFRDPDNIQLELFVDPPGRPDRGP